MNPKLTPLIICILLLTSVTYADPYRPSKNSASSPTDGNLASDSFQADLFTGAAAYSYQIEVPIGTNGLQPSLSLSYNSHNTRGRPGISAKATSREMSYIRLLTHLMISSF